MTLIKQENSLGCGVACVASILNINYQDSLNLFKNGKMKANDTGFLCKEIVMALNKADLNYEYKYIKNKIKKRIYKPNTIVFLRRSKKYPLGHYLCRVNKKWMDPWINFPDKNLKAGYRAKLPETPIYAILELVI